MNQSDFETNFLKNASPFPEYRFFSWNRRLKMQHFHTKLLSQKAILRQVKWGIQNEPITKNGVLPVTTFIFQKFCFSLRASCIGLLFYTNHANVHIHVHNHTFRKRCSCIWGCFVPVSVSNLFRKFFRFKKKHIKVWYQWLIVLYLH